MFVTMFKLSEVARVRYIIIKRFSRRLRLIGKGVDAMQPNIAESQRRYRASEKGKTKHREHMRAYMTAYRQRLIAEGRMDREKQHEYDKKAHRRLRAKVFEVLGGEQCSNCGCNVFEILEINHINGGGRRELKTKQTRQLYRDIIHERVKQDNYNVLCRVRNALHYVETVLGIVGFQIRWGVVKK